MRDAGYRTPRCHVARGAARLGVLLVLAVVPSWRRVVGQSGVGEWLTSPARPTVGDTIWLSREAVAPRGWRLRPGKLESTGQVEPLGDAAVLRAPGGWVIRYPVVVWSPGAHQVALPPVWRLAPDGRTDSLPGGVASLEVRSVIPDSVAHPEPKAFLGPLRPDRRRPLIPLGAILVALGLGAAGVAWRRRAPRLVPASLPVAGEPEIPDTRWLVAGEPKAVAARAAGRLRAAIARAEPEAATALSTAECLAVLERRMPGAPLRRVADVLEQLDRVAFASAHGSDVTELAARARALVRELAP